MDKTKQCTKFFTTSGFSGYISAIGTLIIGISAAVALYKSDGILDEIRSLRIYIEMIEGKIDKIRESLVPLPEPNQNPDEYVEKLKSNIAEQAIFYFPDDKVKTARGLMEKNDFSPEQKRKAISNLLETR